MRSKTKVTSSGLSWNLARASGSVDQQIGAETLSMKISFACPSCNATSSADAAFIGRQVRCKHCGTRFAIRDPDDPEEDVYSLERAADEPAQEDVTNPAQSTFFVPSRGDGTTGDKAARKKRSATGLTPTRARKEKPTYPWLTLLAWSAIVLVVVLAAIALLVPQGTLIAGCVLMAIGSVLILVGYSAGAYGAFCEDFLYGFLYLVIPFYTAYYMATRWEDLWVWLTCSTVGVGLILIGVEVVRWAGVAIG
jgi:transcription elongation factor Elf1